MEFLGKWALRNGKRAIVESHDEAGWHGAMETDGGTVPYTWDEQGNSRDAGQFDLMSRFHGVLERNFGELCAAATD